ncbi:beta-L-arabinofuranosidase domain-containing protein [Paenibacillus sp. HB172176]|uniref:glycoside hydrolase family 127 protein n=1 Tax=Paenibacillus sp. HB172176 TaxID=2493690 RepID=UPI001439A3D7|nr:beta-L-arabinofuranosidase domain-containing protein [Paenibacillus sp. HB172176]
MNNMAMSGAAKPVSLNQTHIQDSFWTYYKELVRDVVVPYQWEALNDAVEGAERSGAVRNFKIAAGMEQGEFYGFVFQDTDVAKWLEAVAYLLKDKRDSELEKQADEMIAIIGKAQHADGYLNTYFTVKAPEARYTNLAECHELYTAGHMIEAGVAYYDATGKCELLDIVIRLADHIANIFGDEEGQIAGYDGHQEIELALMKLYEATGNKKYLASSSYFINKRGAQPSFFEEEADRRGRTSIWSKEDIRINPAYFQAHLPVREQSVATGHAVRVVYMLAGMADVARETGDDSLLAACRALWSNIVEKQMYVTGGIGSMASGEAFSVDYDLPSDTAYAETCASIGLIFAAHRMLQLELKSGYAEAMERALYNTVISGMSRDGKRFFYVNPLEVAPGVCEGHNHNFNHVKPVRQEWFGCACCPPNIARLLASLEQYVYSVNETAVYAHLYIGGQASLSVKGAQVELRQVSGLPWEGNVRFELSVEQPVTFAMAFRKPDWCPRVAIRVNGEKLECSEPGADGYIIVERLWTTGDVAELELEMPVLRMRSHPNVRETRGKVALQRGPLVYCAEEADNGSGLGGLMLPVGAKLQTFFEDSLLGGLQVIEAEASRMREATRWESELYRADREPSLQPERIRFIPYYAWANRGKGEMAVWLKERL